MASQHPVRADDPRNAAPTRARYWVIVFAVTLAILSYIDRVCISQAAPEMSRDLGLSKSQMGLVLAAFGLGYALFEIPGGYLGDWLGPRKVLMRIVLSWSAFTALTGFTRSLPMLWIVRFLFGAGEAGCFPNLTKAFSIWLPTHEKTRAQSIMWMFARWGGAFTPPLVVAVMAYTSWRGAFMLFGVLGLAWAFLFYWWFRDDPATHTGVNKAELALLEESRVNVGHHGRPPWGKLLGSRSIWMLWLQYFCMSYPWYFYITWLPTYLREYRHLDQSTSANYAILPLLFGGFGSLASGVITPWIARRTGNLRLARRSIACTGFLLASIMIVMVIRTSDVMYAMIFMGLASFCNDLIMPPAWATCMDVGGKYAGTVAGSMNMMGNLAGFVAPWLGGKLVEGNPDGWNILLYSMAGIYLLGTLCWPLIDPTTPLEAAGSDPLPAGSAQPRFAGSH